MSASMLTCPLCSCEGNSIDDALTGAEIRALWACHGDVLSADALSPIRDDIKVELHRCCRCGFRFFDPAFAGSERFYAELAREGYYAEEAPEFESVLSFANERAALKRVIDVGCGHGSFLNKAASQGWKTAGLELTPAAAERARAGGHKVLSIPLESLSTGTMEPAGLVTVFQVLEHVKNPVSFLQSAAKLAVEGGMVAVSVPYDSGINGYADLVPHQWPPHHLTRWRHRDLRRLGEVAGLKLVRLRASPLSGRELRRYLRLQLCLTRVIGRATRLHSGLIKVLGGLYSLIGARLWLPAIGPTTTAIYEVPS